MPVFDLSRLTLRAATADDASAIATVWHTAWLDGHLGHVPEALLPHRRLVDFRQRAATRIETTTLATIASCVVGFVTVHDASQVISGGNYQQTLPAPAKGPGKPGDRGTLGPAGFRLD